MTYTHSRTTGFATLALLAVTVLVVTGCSAPAAAPVPVATEVDAAVATQVQEEAKLAFTEWQVESMLGGAASVPVLPNNIPTLAFAMDRFVGFGSCNWFAGLVIYTANNGIQIQAPQRTMGGCVDNMKLQEQEGTYMQLLLDSTRFAMEDGKLVTYTGDQKALTFTKLDPVPFEGTTWQFVLYYSPETSILTPGIPGTTITIKFDGKNASGNTGCNEYNGPYTRNGNTLTFGPLSGTKQQCTTPQGIMQQESAYLTKLQNTGQVAQAPRTLLFSTGDGQPLLMYKAVGR
jgi:heat shock protein HslJ